MNKERMLVAVLFIIGTGAGYFFGKKNAAVEAPAANAAKEEVITRETRAGGYKFINPLVECDCFTPSQEVGAGLLKENLSNYISGAIGAGKATHVSVYFRDLNNGPWIGIGENENFSPASLLKVPLMMGALKRVETEPLFLKKRLVVHAYAEEDLAQNISDSGMVVMGKSYTAEDLMMRAVQHSDNRAAITLWTNLGELYMDQVLKDIQEKVTGDKTPIDDITVKSYSTFFRLLYNASYLNRELSEKALRILTKSTFHDGLVAGLPEGLAIAHKFGERRIENKGTAVLQLHDCGIVYAPGLPYLICVMTRGKDFKELSSVIADISGMVYRNVGGQ